MFGVKKLGRRSRPFLVIFLVLCLLPIGGVLTFAVLPPPTTILMIQQALAGQGLDYRWRGLNDISPNLVYAAIAAEDARFCSHQGFDVEAIQKALETNAEGGKVRGGSTISQQTAKMLGQEDIFTQAMLLNQIKQMDRQFEALLQTGIPADARAYLGMMGFKVVIDMHCEILRVDQPSAPARDDE